MCSQRQKPCLALELLLLFHLVWPTSTQGTSHKLCACDCALKARVRWERGYGVGLSPQRGVWAPGSRYFCAGRRAVASWGNFLSLGKSASLFPQGIMTKNRTSGRRGRKPLCFCSMLCGPGRCFLLFCILNKRKLPIHGCHVFCSARSAVLPEAFFRPLLMQGVLS